MKLAHAGMRMSTSDWAIFISLLAESLNKLKIPTQEKQQVITIITSLKTHIVEQ